ncbi:DUF2639 domain-containing protein [Siminovitchia acidinfaciens]|uniref:DUF2639 domain-containing protein n=1 Tax=Siminovitchia acidinfaciens TaxID=2321395 RepID=A0A429XXD5_9BACI|nr:DUF2639 domain-containing protein [Siminovitchia acidinfaciens]RST73136.1 DUF2639 domain-containing protein [Siminovitchia acidinfaciens]
MVYIYSKGWYIARLKEKGIRFHPETKKKLELYKIYVVRNLYNEFIEMDEGKSN